MSGLCARSDRGTSHLLTHVIGTKLGRYEIQFRTQGVRCGHCQIKRAPWCGRRLLLIGMQRPLVGAVFCDEKGDSFLRVLVQHPGRKLSVVLNFLVEFDALFAHGRAPHNRRERSLSLSHRCLESIGDGHQLGSQSLRSKSGMLYRLGRRLQPRGCKPRVHMRGRFQLPDFFEQGVLLWAWWQGGGLLFQARLLGGYLIFK